MLKRQLNITLFIEDPLTRGVFLDVLADEGYVTLSALPLAADDGAMLPEASDLVLVDLDPLGARAATLLSDLVHKGSNGLVVVLASDARLETALLALRAGVFDLLLKPVAPDELLATVGRVRKAINAQEQKRHAILVMEEMLVYLKRTTGALQRDEMAAATLAHSAGVYLDLEKRQATLGGRALALTPTEFDLLALLVTHPDEPFTSEEILARVKGFSPEPVSARAAVRVYMSRLRHKVEDNPSDPRYLRTVRGVGYMYQDPARV
jgi:DNA-binding response OmpR family regulator